MKTKSRENSPKHWLSFILFAAAIAPPHVFAGPSEAESSSEIRIAEALSDSFRRAVEMARPSIVTIQAVNQETKSDATGLIVDSNGGILTSHHAVEDAEAVFVVLADGRRFPVSEIRSDAWSDLALLRIEDAGELTEARMGGSDAVDIGDWVISAGNSFGLGFSASPGIVSATQRELADHNFPLLQTTAPSNPGSSGGPVLNLRGEVVGICEGGYSVRGGFDGVSFAIPVDVAKFVIRELAKNGTVRWPYLGIYFDTLAPDVAEGLGHPASQGGVILTNVITDSPASRAGLQIGDVITLFDGKPVAGAGSLISALWRAEISEQTKVTILRGNEQLDLSVQLGILPTTIKTQQEESENGVADDPAEVYRAPQVGLSVTKLPSEGSADAISPPRHGVLVQGVAAQSAAHYSGIHPGTVISHVGTQAISDLNEFKKVMKNRSGEAATVLLVQCTICGDHFFAIPPKPPSLPDSSSQQKREELLHSHQRPEPHLLGTPLPRASREIAPPPIKTAPSGAASSHSFHANWR